jgi:MerR family transcriptional regulator, mercuric resistance operon regulatory protein
MPPSTAKEGELLTRGALAARSGCNVETIRYYEHIGILPAPPRSQGGHRLYGHDLIKRLTFVRRSRELGFTLEEIRQLLRLVDGGSYTCAQIEALALQHARDIRQKIADLKKLKSVLETMASHCTGGEVPECPIIDELFDSETPLPSAKNTHQPHRPLRAQSSKATAGDNASAEA